MFPSDPERADKLHEECGVIAVFRTGGSAAALAHRGLFALQHRGQEAAGLASVDEHGELHSLRSPGLVAALPLDGVAALPGQVAIGHVRYSTVTVDHAENIQPFLANTPFGRLAIAHNGNFKNADTLSDALRRDGALLSTTMDTELFVHLLSRARTADLHAALRRACEGVVGAYSLTLLCGQRLLALRDAHGIRPLVIGRLPESDPGWVVASETCALRAVGATLVREVEPGELIAIEATGITSTRLLPANPQPAPCVFELVYFARPDSKVFGQSPHEARVRMGMELAEQDQDLPRPDVVVPVPDSGVSAAVGYARRSGVPFEMAILRSHYVGRTFILPSQDARTQMLRLKLSVVAAAVAGKRVLLVDDSLVRGNTARQIVAMVREAGAAEIWLRLASPPIVMPCFLGIDTPTQSELLLNRAYASERLSQTPPSARASSPEAIDWVRRFVGADHLRYLSLAGLRRATLDRPFCMGCMDGRYPV
jgi:amidophosphoribosyltransferase